MTRVTNLGFKRKYLQAGFDSNPDVDEQSPGGDETAEVTVAAEGDGDVGEEGNKADPGNAVESGQPPKKKRKRTKKKKESKTAGGEEVGDRGDEEGDESEGAADKEGKEDQKPPRAQDGIKKSKNAKAKGKLGEKLKGKSASEKRRLKRIQERESTKTCFACRQTGHAAKDCPVVLKTSAGEGEGEGTEQQGVGEIKLKSVAGICYRCGSKRHTLSRCKKPIDAQNPLPFAHCFVCGGKGHLASTCSQNKGKGVYPNGGCCKLCGETSHLAKDCHLRRPENQNAAGGIYGTGKEAGADEDDFHLLKRRTREVERDERREDKLRKSLKVKAGVQSGIIKSFAAPAGGAGGAGGSKPAKKVVYF
ncbi:hypothetical protein AX16_001792 [Volvariella volvacea WC 439]|nr:hypothetical protein AX16_001792 [Volvariella volvacea WC 439]